MSWDIDTAARTLAQESRGEPIEGQTAVAHVLVNRLRDGRWGRSLASVCLWPRQFSGWSNAKDPNFAYACNLRDEDPMLDHMRGIIESAFHADDPTQGALFYYADYIQAPSWAASMKPCGKFGRQFFLTDKLGVTS